MRQVKIEEKTSVHAYAGQPKRARILVVEDYKNLQRVFSTMLGDMGFEVAHAENGLEALAAFLDSPFDLVLIDLQIPIMNAAILAHFIKEVSPKTSVILLTGADEETVRPKATTEAIHSVILKPFDTSDFETTVRGALELKKGESPPPSNRRRSAMNAERNPVWRQGNRNVFCPLYKECLDDAIKGSWQDWDCNDCLHKLNHQNEPDPLLAAARAIDY